MTASVRSTHRPTIISRLYKGRFRVEVVGDARRSVATEKYDLGMSSDDNHDAAVRAALAEWGIDGEWVGGETGGLVRVYVRID